MTQETPTPLMDAAAVDNDTTWLARETRLLNFARSLECRLQAMIRWKAGEKPSFSTGICGSLTAGYGKLDADGYFEFPLMPAEDYMNPSHAEARAEAMAGLLREVRSSVSIDMGVSGSVHRAEDLRKLIERIDVALSHPLGGGT